MIEKTIRDFLLTVLTVPVYTDIPAEPPASFVLIERTGGGETEHIRSAMVAIQSYAASRLAAGELHESVLSLMKRLIELDSISACDLNAEYDYTDTTTKQFRYQAVCDIIYY